MKTFKCGKNHTMYFTGLKSVSFTYKMVRRKPTSNNVNNTKWLSFTEYSQHGL